MAAQSKPKKHRSLFDEPSKKGDLEALVEQIRENPAVFAAVVLFLIFCAMAGMFYRSYSIAQDREVLTAYAKALDLEEPAEQAAALEKLAAEHSGPRSAEVLYLAAEKAYQAADYEKAKSLYERVRTEYADTTIAPDAVEGLGYVAENAGEFDTALQHYNEVTTRWPQSFAALRQPSNIARVEEKRGNLEKAVASYREQITSLPGSNLALDAQEALARLSKAHPELFTAPASPVPAGSGDAPSIPGLVLPDTPGIQPPGSAPAQGRNTNETTPPETDAPSATVEDAAETPLGSVLTLPEPDTSPPQGSDAGAPPAPR